MTPEQVRAEVRAAIKAELPTIVDAVWNETENVNVGYRAKDETGKARPASMQRLRSVLAYLSPEGHETRALLRQVLDELRKLNAPTPPAP